jgi:hypothetical protein
MANRVRREKLWLLVALLGAATPPKGITIEPVADSKGDVERVRDAHVCPVCKEGHMVICDVVVPTPRKRTVGLEYWRSPELAHFNTS